MNILEDFKSRLENKIDLSVNETAELFNALRTANDERLILPLLRVWSEKGYTSTELSTCAKILRDNCVRLETAHKTFIDIVGSGGSKAKVFNVSTGAAFVIAGAGIAVAKHGNKAASSLTGSADALSHLNVNTTADPENAKICLDEIGICFMFAPRFHNLTKELAIARKNFGKPTIFNLLGPMANPANAPFQLIGVWNKEFLRPMAEAVATLGTKRTWIVHGEDGLDEITLNGKTSVAQIIGDEIDYFQIAPEDFGLEEDDLSGYRDISPELSATIIRGALDNQRGLPSSIDIVLINAAAAIYIAGYANTYVESVEIARNSITSGAAFLKLNELIEETNR